jgi:hypothetical protein
MEILGLNGIGVLQASEHHNLSCGHPPAQQEDQNDHQWGAQQRILLPPLW